MIEFGFYLKKFVSFFVEPYGMVLSLFVIWFILSKIKKEKLAKISLSLAFGLLFLFSYPPFANFLIANLENQYPKYDYKQDVKYIHVLGSGHIHDESQPLSSQVRATGLTRVIEGIIIHKQTKESKLIFTGYKGDTDISNAIMHTKLAIALGVKEENIVTGKSPKDTKEEANFTKELIGDEPFVLVTSANHMPRAIRLFKSVGLNPIAAPTNFQKRNDLSFFNLPEIGSFNISQRAMHEYWGILWSKIREF